MFPLIIVAFIAYSWKPTIKKRPVVQTEATVSSQPLPPLARAPSPQPRVVDGGPSFLNSAGGQLLAASLARRIAPPRSGVAIAADVSAGLGVARAGIDVLKSAQPLFKRDLTPSTPVVQPRYQVVQVEPDWQPTLPIDETPPVAYPTPSAPDSQLDWSGLPQYDPSLETPVEIVQPPPIMSPDEEAALAFGY